MGRNIVDVFHIEDDEGIRSIKEGQIRAESMSYEGTASLDGLRNFLNSRIAKVYLLDGRFPEKEPKADELGDIEFNAPKAIRIIREKCGIDANIIILSTDNPEKFQGFNVRVFSKGERPQEMLTLIKEKVRTFEG